MKIFNWFKRQYYLRRKYLNDPDIYENCEDMTIAKDLNVQNEINKLAYEKRRRTLHWR